MALQTQTFSWGSYAYKSESNAYVLELILTEISTSIETNSSVVAYELNLKSGINNRFEATLKSTLKLNGITVATKTDDKYLDYSSTWRLLSGETVVSHNLDGTLNMPIEASIDVLGTNKYAPPDKTIEWSWELTRIPRASNIESITDIVLGDSCVITWSPNHDSFKYKLDFAIGSWSNQTDYIEPQQTTSYEYGIVISGADEKNGTTIYKQLPDTTVGEMSVTLTTYGEDGEQIGPVSTKTFKIAIPSDILPTIGEMLLIPETINGHDMLVKGKNKLALSVSGCQPSIGSIIRSYTFSGPSLSVTTTETQVIVSSVSSAGELTYTITVTDSRGRIASVSKSIECFDYYAPSFYSFDAYRTDADANPNINGSYLKCEYKYDYAKVNNTNEVSLTIHYNNLTSDQTLINLGDTEKTYNVFMTIEDAYGGVAQTSTITVFGESRILNITSDGTGIAIGKMASSSNLFECRWDAKFDGDLECVNIEADKINCDSLVIDDLSCESVNCTDAVSVTINCDEILIQQKTIFDLIYPIGSIYMSTNNVSPQVLFGGTWEQIKDKFLLAAGDSYSAGSTGGETEHVLTIDEMPAHAHDFEAVQRDSNETTLASGNYGYVTNTTSTKSAGGGNAHNNMPPYLTVFIWQRIE